MPPRTKRTATKARPKAVKAVEEEIDDLEIEEEVEETPAPKKRGRRPAKKPVQVVEEDDEEEGDDEADEEEETPAPKKRGRPKKAALKVVEDEDEEEEKPKAKRTPPKRPEIKYGTAWLAEYIEEQTGTAYTPYDLRVLLRKLAKKGVLDREVGTERARYEFTGPKDPVVAKIIKAVKNGDIEKAKKDSLDKLKSRAAEKKAAGPAKKRSAKKPAPVEDDDVDDEEIDDEDFEELED